MEMKGLGFFKENKLFIAIIIAGFTIGGFIYSAAKSIRPESGTETFLSEGSAGAQLANSQSSSWEASTSQEQSGSALIVREEGSSSAAAQGGSCVSYTDAGNFVGENKCVFGKVDNVYMSSGGTTFLDFCPDYKTCPFSAVIFKPDSFNFTDLKQYQGKTIEITGLVKTYQGRPEIILKDASQIKIK
ncbi:MAG: hypothetical protein WC921_00580 [Candidatus Paceibacterota bacterium]